MQNLTNIRVLRPKYILLITIILIFIIVSINIYELLTSKQDIMKIIQEEAISLAESISIMGDNSLACFDMMEELVFKRLMDNARILEDMDYKGQLTESGLKALIERNDIYRVDVFSVKGNVVMTSHRDIELLSEIEDLTKRISPILNGVEKESIIIINEGEKEHYAAGIYRRKGGAILVSLHSDDIIKLRRNIGIGNLIQDIGENEGIEYIVLQDQYGLILASKNIKEMKKISGDEFLENAIKNKWMDTRVYLFNDREVLEVVSPFQINEESYGLFRIGLSMNEVRSVEAKSRQRLILATFIALAVGIISFTLILVNQNYSLLSNAYEEIKTYTGTVLENIADGIIVVREKGIISVFNKAAEQIFQKSSQQMIGKSLDELNLDMMKMLNDSYTQTNQELILKIPVEKDRTRLISVRFSKIAEADDSTIFIVRDMTEIKLMEENIRRTEQLTAMGKLASAVAHEVRNPLNAISIIGQRLRREFKPAEKEEEYFKLVDLVKSESSRLNGIVEEFLKFARPPKLNRQPTDMAQLLNETITMIEVQARDQGIEIKKIYTHLGHWTVDKEQLKQALLNLLLNGIEAMPKGGILSIKGYVNENGLYIDISDTGRGIPEEDLNRIFDLYFTTKETGTGLGLSIVQRIIMEHGGWVHVDSILNRGTTFSIYIP